MTRCEKFYDKVIRICEETKEDPKQREEKLKEFCDKSPSTIGRILDAVEYEKEHLDALPMGSYSERSTRPLRALLRKDEDLHRCALDLVLNEGMEPREAVRKAQNGRIKNQESHKDVILSDIRDIRLKDVDLILTDPPYPKEYLGLWSVLFEKAAEGLKEGGFLVTYAPHIYLPQIFEASKPLKYVWTIAQIHAGEKTAYHPSRVNIGWKPILVFVKGEIPDIDYYDDVLQGKGREKDDHEWQQALGESELLIRIFTQEGALVVDPFVGSGTTALAARNTSRNFLVFDNDEEAINTTLRRLSE